MNYGTNWGHPNDPRNDDDYCDEEFDLLPENAQVCDGSEFDGPLPDVRIAGKTYYREVF